MSDDALEAISLELDRIGASAQRAGGRDSIAVNDEGDGWASLGASPQRRDLYWYGRTEAILKRLGTLTDASGADAVRREFATDVPEDLGESCR